jgi:hypothetical protein
MNAKQLWSLSVLGPACTVEMDTMTTSAASRVMGFIMVETSF